MSRIRSFLPPHKGLRNILSKFSLLAGATDYADATEFENLKRLGNEMFFLLADHVHTEDHFTLKQLEEMEPGASYHDMHDHEELETIQEALVKDMEALDETSDPDAAHIFYLAFTDFHSRYLQHILHEEMVTEELLWKHFTDEELLEHRKDVMKRFEFPVLLLWLKYIIPAQKFTENQGMLRGLKMVMPGQAFEKIIETIRPEMQTKTLDNLLAALG